MSKLWQRGCLTLQMFLLQRILLRRPSASRKPCLPRILESKSPKGRGTANCCRKRAYETIIQVYHHLRPPTRSKSLLVRHNRTQAFDPWNVSRLRRWLIFCPIRRANQSGEPCNGIHPQFSSSRARPQIFGTTLRIVGGIPINHAGSTHHNCFNASSAFQNHFSRSHDDRRTSDKGKHRENSPLWTVNQHHPFNHIHHNCNNLSKRIFLDHCSFRRLDQRAHSLH